MKNSLAARVSGLMRQMLDQSGWLRSELRSLDQAGRGHPCMRELCEQLDSLDSSIVWDLRDELRGMSSRQAPQAARILDWLRADVDPLVDLVCRLDRECADHPLVSAAMLACGEIVGLFRDIERAFAPRLLASPPAIAAPCRSLWPAADPPRLC